MLDRRIKEKVIIKMQKNIQIEKIIAYSIPIIDTIKVNPSGATPIISITFPIHKANRFPITIPVIAALPPIENTSLNKALDSRFFYVTNARNTPISLHL